MDYDWMMMMMMMMNDDDERMMVECIVLENSSLADV